MNVLCVEETLSHRACFLVQLLALWMITAFFSAEIARAQFFPDSARSLQLGAMIQVEAHVSGDSLAGRDGFQLGSARLSAEGELTPRLAYELEADFSDGFTLKDARIDYRLLPDLLLKAGQFKALFSYGALTSSSETPFVRRPRVVEALRLDRQVGLGLEYRPRSGRFVLRGSVFNGAALEDETADSDGATEKEHLFLYVGRATWQHSGPEGEVSAGINASYDASAEGRRLRAGLRYGADVHVARGRGFMTAEALARAEPQPGLVSSGGYVTVGFAVEEVHLLRMRLDHVRREEPAGDAASTLLGAGYTFMPDSPLRLEVDYLMPLASAPLVQSILLVNLQISL